MSGCTADVSWLVIIEGGAGVVYVFPNVLPTVMAVAICITMVLSSESKPSANIAYRFIVGAYPCCLDVDLRIPTAMSWHWNAPWTNV